MESKVKRSGTARDTDKQLVLTPGEKLLVLRRRRGWNQSKAAKYYGVSLFEFKLAEYDKAKGAFNYPSFEGNLTPWEFCLIYRKRSGLTQAALAKKIGICRSWLRYQEANIVPCDKLFAWWEKNNKK